MAAYHPCAFVALLLIYSTNAYNSTYNGSKTGITKNLLQEKACKFQAASEITTTSEIDLTRVPRFAASSSSHSDWVCGQNGFAKGLLCEEVLDHLIREQNRDVLERLLDAGNIQEPRIAKRGDTAALVCRNVYVDGVNTFVPMYWCPPRRYRKRVSQASSSSSSGSNIGEIYGFFCAGSTKNIDRVYVFRPEKMNDEKVKPIAELNNCTGWKDVHSPESPDDDVSVYRFGGNEPL